MFPCPPLWIAGAALRISAPPAQPQCSRCALSSEPCVNDDAADVVAASIREVVPAPRHPHKDASSRSALGRPAMNEPLGSGEWRSTALNRRVCWSSGSSSVGSTRKLRSFVPRARDQPVVRGPSSCNGRSIGHNGDSCRPFGPWPPFVGWRYR